MLVRRSVSLILLAACVAVAQADEIPDAASGDLDTVIINGKALSERGLATEVSPSQVSVDAVTPTSIVSNSFIRNFVSPVADYTQVLAMTPGAFGFSPNGVGLGDTKVTIRGLSDSNFNITFDNIPFNDTNGVSHHSWTFFPSQFLGGAVVDRSPGTAGSIGQATYGGSIDLRSRVLSPDESRSVTVSDGSWDTRLIDLEYQAGDFGENKDQRLLVNLHKMTSDGYQSYNDQNRTGGSFKYQTQLSESTQLTIFNDYLRLTSNTPSVKGVTRANYNEGNYTALMSGDPIRANYYGYNFYVVPTTFTYVGIVSQFDGWTLEDKLYRYSYHNKENYNGTTISATSAVDKLNSYQTTGNLLRADRDYFLGQLRLGLWADNANSYRYQIKSDPRTWVDVQVPNFSETYTTRTLQPYLENEFKITEQFSATAGIKYASYHQSFNHLQDNGGAVGTLGGIFNSATNTVSGGLPSIGNTVTYTDWLPSFSAHYLLTPNWSTYAQYAYGDSIPSTSVFDVKNAQVTPTPKPQVAKVAQVGTVWAAPQVMAAMDVYHIRLDDAYLPTPPDAFGNVGYVLSGVQTSKGVEGEVNYVVGAGLSVYANATVGSVKLASGVWVPGAPKDTEKLGLTYMHQAWASSVQVERIGENYNAGKASNQDFLIAPVTVTNLFVNYTFDQGLWILKKTKIQASVNNLFNRHNIVGVASGVAGSTSATPQAGDLLTILPALSANLTITASF